MKEFNAQQAKFETATAISAVRQASTDFIQVSSLYWAGCAQGNYHGSSG